MLGGDHQYAVLGPIRASPQPGLGKYIQQALYGGPGSPSLGLTVLEPAPSLSLYLKCTTTSFTRGVLMPKRSLPKP